MTTLPQPPPDAEAPPLAEAALGSRRRWRWIWVWVWVWVWGIVLMVMMLVLVASHQIRFSHMVAHHPGEAINNARQIGLALFQFEMDYGDFPSPATIPVVQKETGTLLSLGTSASNDYFRQLVGSGIAHIDSIFSYTVRGSAKSENRVNKAHTPNNEKLGFAYLAGLTSKGNPSRPIVVTPMIPGTDRFDPEPFDGKALILRMDISVNSFPIEKDGHVLLNGRNILDPKHPVWGGKPPVIVLPE